jgi:integration host factor subunit beta
MTKSELIDVLAAEQDQLAYKDVEEAVRKIIDRMSAALATGERIEIRGFGSFSLHYRPPRIGRNPKTGDPVALAGKHVPHFKPGKDLRDRANGAFPGATAETALARGELPASEPASGGPGRALCAVHVNRTRRASDTRRRADATALDGDPRAAVRTFLPGRNRT